LQPDDHKVKNRISSGELNPSTSTDPLP
jgi:hypothetical protein